MNSILVTGARGFIGFNAIQRWIKQNPKMTIIAVDANTYADKFLLEAKESIEDNINHQAKRDVIKHFIYDLTS